MVVHFKIYNEEEIVQIMEADWDQIKPRGGWRIAAKDGKEEALAEPKRSASRWDVSSASSSSHLGGGGGWWRSGFHCSSASPT